MKVYQKDGSVQTFKVEQVERVAFEEKEELVLSNQYAINDAVKTIGSVVEERVDGGYKWALYEAENITDMTETPAISLFVAQESMGKTLDLSTMTAAEATISIADAPEYTALTGTLKAALDKFGKNISISLNAETDGYDNLLIAYNGTFATTYTASGLFNVTPAGGETVTGNVRSLLCMPATEAGAATSFALGDAETTTAEGFADGQYAIWISLSPSVLYSGKVDMATATDSYTFKFIDYTTGNVTETVTAGAITTHKATDGKTYIAIEATLADGTAVAAEFFGAALETASLEGMIPQKTLPNEYVFYNADGKINLQYTITKVEYKVSGKGLYVFYLESEEESSYSCPQLSVAPELINAGDIDLSALAPNTFQIKYSSFQLYSPDGDYRHIPTNGTMRISKDDNDNYEIFFDAMNDYYQTQSGNTLYGGDNTRLTISYKGAVSAK